MITTMKIHPRQAAKDALTDNQRSIYMKILGIADDLYREHEGLSGDFYAPAPSHMQDADFEALQLCLPRGVYFEQSDIMITLA